MNTVELIRRKRDGYELTKQEIDFLIKDFTKGNIPDYQFAAFLMAAYLNGMSDAETAYLTKAMLLSGDVLNLKNITGSKIDKHSTGGVGDKVSLIVVPIVASAGVKVPKISGRGLGHTGGTLDKLESIPGYRTDLSQQKFESILRKCGAVITGQTSNIAPADKVIYALRDVTATIESIPLITASIMSKKLAKSIDGLVLDVKTGSGAFMVKTKDAIKLANSLISTAKSFNTKVIAFITDMNHPLGGYIGNWLEVYESIRVLSGKKKGALLDLSISLSGAMIYLGKKASSIDNGIEKAKTQIENGQALDKFKQIVKAQGGDIRFIDNPESYPRSKNIKKVYSQRGGFIKEMDTYKIGLAALELGAGRKTKGEKIDPKAGIIFKVEIGSKVRKGETIAELHSDSIKKINIAKELVETSIEYSGKKTRKPALIKKIIK